MKYRTRYLEDKILKLNKTFKVLYLGGPRQVGKTTLLRHLAESFNFNYVSLDDLAARKLAQEDPGLFLQKYQTPLFIDEVQYAPELFPYIKLDVDKKEKNGRYWLTGSQQFSLMKNLKESLAGRVGILSLLGFSLAEIYNFPKNKKSFLPEKQLDKEKKINITTIFRHILNGSFPVIYNRNAPPLKTFYNSYLQTYLDRDLKDIFNITKISTFHTFLQLCAAMTGQILNYSELAKDAGISVTAAREWISILEASKQIYLLRPYYKNISKRLIKAPKIYFLDTGLAAFLTKWETADTLMNSTMAGPFFETFVIGEILKSYYFRGEDAPIYYFRDKEKHEVDLIIEKNGILYPIEIKIASLINKSDLKGINYFRKKMPNAGKGAIICLAQNYLSLDRQNDIIPVSMIN